MGNSKQIFKRYLTPIALLALCLVALTGCGGKGGDDYRRALVRMVIRKEERHIPAPEGKDANWYLVGSQYYQGEPVQIWAARNTDGGLDISLYRGDGSLETLLADAPTEYGATWFLDQDGNRYILPGGRDSCIIRLDKGGGELYRRQGDAVQDICQLQDGKILVLLSGEDRRLRLAELDPGTGTTADIKAVELAMNTAQSIGAGGDRLLLLDGDGLWAVSLRDGGKECLMPFGGTYRPGAGVRDFRVLGDGRLEILQHGGLLQTLELCDPSEGREIIVLRRAQILPEMQNYAAWFNQSSEDYYVVMEACPEDMSLSDFRAQTGMQLATGKGADIICATSVDDIWNLIDKGGIEDLAPWMEGSGIREEDYFPPAFACLRDGDRIYGINMKIDLQTFYIDKAVLGEETAPDIEALVDDLLAYGGEEVFHVYMGGADILEYFLRGSENLWGMLDPEAGTCDFSGSLFARMLEAARRYADDKETIHPALGRSLSGINYYSCDYDEQQRREDGLVNVGYFFDDGPHTIYTRFNWMAVSSSSPNKEGAWAFLRFLLSDGVQLSLQERGETEYAASRRCFEENARQAIAEGVWVPFEEDGTSGMKIRGGRSNLVKTIGLAEYLEIFNATEEKVGKIRALLEDARTFSQGNLPILEIIYEEAEEYFSGSKKIEEVTAIIQNRVQLYLDEHK